MGLFLSGQRFAIGKVGTSQMVLLGAMSTASVLAFFGMESGDYAEETEATTVVSAAASPVTIAALTTLIGTRAAG